MSYECSTNHIDYCTDVCTVQYEYSTAAEDLIEGHEATRDDTTRTIRYPLT